MLATRDPLLDHFSTKALGFDNFEQKDSLDELYTLSTVHHNPREM